MNRWTPRSSRAFHYLTEKSALPKVVRVKDESPPESDERPSDRILKLLESEGWAVHNDPELLAFLGNVDIAERVPEKLQGLIAEVLYFCYELDEVE